MDGNVTDINLTAGLDVNTSDMLVPVGEPTFQHNWQRYQGKFLPNSIRFEKNGWAAGWNVYDFDFKTISQEANGHLMTYTVPTDYIERITLSDLNSLELTHVDVIKDSKSLSNNAVVDGNIMSGSFNNGTLWEVEWDGADWTGYDPARLGVTNKVNADGTLSVHLEDLFHKLEYNFDVYLGQSLTGDVIDALKYDGYADGVHSWGEYVYNGESIKTPEGVYVYDFTLQDNAITFRYDYTETLDTLNLTFAFKDYFDKFSITLGEYKITDVIDKNNKIIYNASGDIPYGGSTDVDITMPGWIEFGVDYSGGSIVPSLCDNTDTVRLNLREPNNVQSYLHVYHIVTGEFERVRIPSVISTLEDLGINDRFLVMQSDATIYVDPFSILDTYTKYTWDPSLDFTYTEDERLEILDRWKQLYPGKADPFTVLDEFRAGVRQWPEPIDNSRTDYERHVEEHHTDYFTGTSAKPGWRIPDPNNPYLSMGIYFTNPEGLIFTDSPLEGLSAFVRHNNVDCADCYDFSPVGKAGRVYYNTATVNASRNLYFYNGDATQVTGYSGADNRLTTFSIEKPGYNDFKFTGKQDKDYWSMYLSKAEYTYKDPDTETYLLAVELHDSLTFRYNTPIKDVQQANSALVLEQLETNRYKYTLKSAQYNPADKSVTLNVSMEAGKFNIYGMNNSTEGYFSPAKNMSVYDSILLSMTAPVSLLSLPYSVYGRLRTDNSSGMHPLYSKGASVMSSGDFISVGEYNAELGIVPMSVGGLDCVWNVVAGIFSPSEGVIAEEDGLYESRIIAEEDGLYESRIVAGAYTLDDDNMVTVTLIDTMQFNNMRCKIGLVPTAGYTLTGIDKDGLYKIQRDGRDIEFDGTKVVSPVMQSQDITGTDSLRHIAAVYVDYVDVKCVMPRGVGCTFDENNAYFNFDGYNYTFDLAAARGDETGIKVKSTDIRDPEHTANIGYIKPDKQYQFLKQQWNTDTSTENFWWIDSMHVLELTKSHFVLKRNTKVPDDWNGDMFTDVFRLDRSDILTTDILRYFCTNVYDTEERALFVTVSVDQDNIKLEMYDVRPSGFELFDTIKMPVVYKELGTVLNDSITFNTYNRLTAANIVSKAKWSSTRTDNYIIIGCHWSDNFDQWSIVYDSVNKQVTKVIQGYGYVGLHGDLTGGMIPSEYVDVSKGFNSTVNELKTLGFDPDPNDLDSAVEVTDASQIKNVTRRIVGTPEQQWYIQQTLSGITAFLEFNPANGTFKKGDIPISNTYAAGYYSPSFGSTGIGDPWPQYKSIFDIFFGEKVSTVVDVISKISAVGSIILMAPRLGMFLYLQQSLGQYAYVHYNSGHYNVNEQLGDETASDWNERYRKEIDTRRLSTLDYAESRTVTAGLDSRYLFDKQKVTQKIDLSMNAAEAGLWGLIVSSTTATLQYIDNFIPGSINSEYNTMNTEQYVEKMTANVFEAGAGMAKASLKTRSVKEGAATNTVTAIKSLDMFYNTSDSQQVNAGPGFCEHQYVAQCVAQSVTAYDIQGKVTQGFYAPAELVTWLPKLEAQVLRAAGEAAFKLGDAWKLGITGAFTAIGNPGVAIAIAFYTGGCISYAMAEVIDIAVKVTEDLVSNLSNNGILSNVDNGVPDQSRFSVEGKHKYGEKPETFMWPCWGVETPLNYMDETVSAGKKVTWWPLSQNLEKAQLQTPPLAFKVQVPNMSAWGFTAKTAKQDFWTEQKRAETDAYMKRVAVKQAGEVPFYEVAPLASANARALPADMAMVVGAETFLPQGQVFKDKDIGESEPAFTTSAIQDYVIDKNWDLSQACTMGRVAWVSVKDTKLLHGAPSNMIVTGSFCGLASTYTAVEIKKGISERYIRPWAITPTTLAFNNSGYNAIFDNKLYHAFDGYSYRLVEFVGSPGMNKSLATYVYSFQKNDRFKRGNILNPNQFLGNFKSEPVQAVNGSIDEFYTIVTRPSEDTDDLYIKGTEGGTVGEDKRALRYSLPIFTEELNTLPAAVKTIGALTLNVYDGVTSLCSNNANLQLEYKTPESVDFTIGKTVYRATNEYISRVTLDHGIEKVEDITPTLGLKFIGSTPLTAYFYSESTRHYYMFSGGSLEKADMIERFRNVKRGYWDFVNQEVVMPCLMTYKRLNPEVEDKDTETDNIIVPLLGNEGVSGELPPPLTTIFNDRSWFRCVSLPCGFAYQGPNRVIINRGIFVEYMERSMKENLNKWKKLDREKYTFKRGYESEYKDVLTKVEGVDGWTYNPFVLVTSPLGTSEDTDSLFEWNITFCWPVEMDLLYGQDNFACVNVSAETMTVGGKVMSRPTHIFLTRELFTRSGSYGYYSFKFTSKNGAGNRERLHIWSDQYIAISGLSCTVKEVTQNRVSQLVQQADVTRLSEL